MDETKNTTNLLEAMEENKNQARQFSQAWHMKFKGLGVGEEQKRLLENIRQAYTAQVINKRIPCISRV